MMRQRWLGGHLNIGRMTIYGRNAMHWAINIRTRRWGYVCFRLPLRCFGGWWPLYLYSSANGTPWAATFMIGGDPSDRARARRRFAAFGHNFDVGVHYRSLCSVNDRSLDGCPLKCPAAPEEEG